jgi:hypothetical protein
MKTIKESFTLLDVLNYPEQYPLTPEQIQSLVEMLCRRCRVKTWNRIRSALTYRQGVSAISIYERVQITPSVQYFAGQDYPAELAYIRKTLTGE